MRATVEFEDDTAQALAQLRSETGMGLSETVNVLVRRGLLAEEPSARFVQETHRLGIRIDVTNVADAIDLLEGHQVR
ncbi:MAG: CopG family transcriptional regulator [Acidimicrobiia bacterium]|nr:CopG family transcriptional regulator [Acidimicrobiia bacterium]MCY4457308.1 hypothetical protein [Acidimicrobiaceae bacterium]